MTELVVVDRKEFGLEEVQALEIQNKFVPVIEKMLPLVEEYEKVKDLDPSEPKNSKLFKALRLSFVKVRTEARDLHKDTKAFYLAGGRYVDSWKNKQIEVSENYEKDLETKEKHLELLEAKRKEELLKARIEKLGDLACYLPNGVVLAELAEEDFNAMQSFCEMQHNAKLENEKKLRLAEVKKLKSQQRYLQLAKYAKFIPDFDKLDLADISDADFFSMLDDAEDKEAKYEEEQAKIKADNDKLIKEQNEAKEKQEKINQRYNRIAKYAHVIDGFDNIDWANESDFSFENFINQAEIAIKKQADKEAKAKKDALDAIYKEKEKNEKLLKEIAEQKRIEAEKIKEIEEQKEKERVEKLEAEKKAMLSPDKDKLKSIIRQLSGIEYPELTTEKGKECKLGIETLIEKTINYINKKIKEME